MSYLRFLHPAIARPPAAEAETATVRRIVGQLEALPPAQAAYVAGFAYILSRVANADLEVTPAETAEMERLVAGLAGLSEAQAVLVVEIAKTQARLEGATEDYLVTRHWNELATPEQRESLLHCLFAVATAAGGTISAQENAEIRQVSDELGYSLAELNVVRSAYADRISAIGALMPPAAAAGNAAGIAAEGAGETPPHQGEQA